MYFGGNSTPRAGHDLTGLILGWASFLPVGLEGRSRPGVIRFAPEAAPVAEVIGSAYTGREGGVVVCVENLLGVLAR